MMMINTMQTNDKSASAENNKRVLPAKAVNFIAAASGSRPITEESAFSSYFEMGAAAEESKVAAAPQQQA